MRETLWQTRTLLYGWGSTFPLSKGIGIISAWGNKILSRGHSVKFLSLILSRLKQGDFPKGFGSHLFAKSPGKRSLDRIISISTFFSTNFNFSGIWVNPNLSLGIIMKRLLFNYSLLYLLPQGHFGKTPSSSSKNFRGLITQFFQKALFHSGGY